MTILLGDDDEPEDDLELDLEDETPDEEESNEEASEDESTGEADEEEPTPQRSRESSDVKAGGRAETRIQKLANERREAATRATKAEAELKVLKDAQENAQRTQQNFQQQQLEQQRLQALWEQSGPEDRMAMMLEKQRRETQQLLFQQQAHMADADDRMRFDRLVDKDAVAAKYKNEVENRLNKVRGNGFSASREDIYKHLLGEKVMAARAKASASQSKTGKANIKKQTVPARRTTSDRTGGRSTASEQEARRKRLENVIL
jgi:hypothetical protein